MASEPLRLTEIQILKDEATRRMEALGRNPYPGRGIILGEAQDGSQIQIYWVMGRSENSRNRILTKEPDGTVKTKAFDESKVVDPSLVIYNAMRVVNGYHIVTNGDQTDTIANFLNEGKSFEQAIQTRTFEPDGPNYTPRISGIIGPDGNSQIAIIRRSLTDQQTPVRDYYYVNAPGSGLGSCIHTYAGDGNPLPQFENNPYPVLLEGNLDQIANTYWDLLNKENKVALVAKSISLRGIDHKIINKLG